MKPTLKIEDLKWAANELKCSLAAIQAVDEVESNGSGFDSKGRPVILFEGHIFWKELEKAGINPRPYAAQFPHVVYRRWTREHYSKGNAEKRNEGEHERLNIAFSIHKLAAIKSASWGRYQILGQNYKMVGFESVENFYYAMDTSERKHLEAFVQFVFKARLDDELQDLRWADFARIYNGPGYAQNKYDVKLEKAYNKFAK